MISTVGKSEQTSSQSQPMLSDPLNHGIVGSREASARTAREEAQKEMTNKIESKSTIWLNLRQAKVLEVLLMKLLSSWVVLKDAVVYQVAASESFLDDVIDRAERRRELKKCSFILWRF